MLQFQNARSYFGISVLDTYPKKSHADRDKLPRQFS